MEYNWTTPTSSISSTKRPCIGRPSATDFLIGFDLFWEFVLPERTHGRGSLVVKVSDSWQVHQEFEPGIVEDPPLQRRLMHTKNVEAQTSSRWCGVEVEGGASSIVT
ncbi:hypothetical protein TNCV_463191 [Trichonephila clavipes]|nr:hypothetical protein TNCV_463191 [Trichonephila clavipes]